MKRFYNLSHPQTEYLITDRHSFQRFIGLHANLPAPDFSTIWKKEEQLTQHGCIDEIFIHFNKFLCDQGYGAGGGNIIDATIVEVPRQRNSRKENAQIKKGKTPGRFQKNLKVFSQKDLDARWTKKNNVFYYGYKDHISVDKDTKLITDYLVTSASMHDSTPGEAIIDPPNTDDLWADSAYETPAIKNRLKKYGTKDHINAKGCKHRKLTRQETAMNKQKSKVRSRVEHVFGTIETSMNGSFIRTIGIGRACFQIGWMNTVYNMLRYTQLQAL